MPTLDDFADRYGFSAGAITQFPNSERAWCVETPEGTFVLRLHGHQHRGNHAAEISALRYLEVAGFPAPRLIEAPNGDTITKWDDRSGYLTTFIHGESLEPNRLQAGDVGCLLAGVHSLDIDGAGLIDTTFTVKAKRDYFESLDANPDVRAWEGYEDIRGELSAAWDELPDFLSLPRTLIHTDVLFHNVIRTPGDALVFIDWEGCGIGPAIQDIGYFLGYGIPHEGAEFGTDITRAFLEGYASVRSLRDAEWLHLPDAILFGSIFTVLWYSMVYQQSWKRTQYVLRNREEIAQELARIRDSLPD